MKNDLNNKQAILLLDDFNIVFSQEELTNAFTNSTSPNKSSFLIYTTKGEKDFNRFSLEQRLDPAVISWFCHKYNGAYSIYYYNPDTEIPVIQLDTEHPEKEVFSTIQK